MKMHVMENGSFSLCPKSYTWIIRKQPTCFGGTEYMIEIKELIGCVSYGDTLAEAKKGLKESIQLWFKHRSKNEIVPVKTRNHIVHIEPNMTKAEFEQINKKLLHILLN